MYTTYTTSNLNRINVAHHRAILAELSNGEQYAYRLKKQLAADGRVPETYNLYLAAHSLARRGLVASRIEGATKLKPGRRYYRLTDMGRSVLATA